MRYTLVSNARSGFTDGVEVAVVGDMLSIYRYIEDWDEDGDTIYEANDYLIDIPCSVLKKILGVKDISGVLSWIKDHLIAEQSNSLDAIEAFFNNNKIPYRYTYNRDDTVFCKSCR